MRQQDRSNIVISAIWYERFLECSRTYGTSEYSNSVWRFYHSLLDIDKENLNIKTMVKKFINTIWNPKIKHYVDVNTINTTDPGVIDNEYNIVVSQYIDEVFDFIIQTIQDSGIGWHINLGSGKGYYVGPENIQEFTG